MQKKILSALIDTNIYSRWVLLKGSSTFEKKYFELKGQTCFPVRNFCQGCGNNEIKVIQPINGVGLVECDCCGLVSTQYVPNENYLKSYYTNTSVSTKYNEATIALNKKRYLELLESFEPFRLNNKILEVGCGKGDFLEAAESKLWNSYGCELSVEKYKICKKKSLNVTHGCITQCGLDNNDFDVIVLIEVIEHLYDIDAVIKQCFSLLRKGGVLYVTTPNFNSVAKLVNKKSFAVVNFPEHLSYFTNKSLTNVLERNNFKKLKCNSEGVGYINFKIQNPATDIKERVQIVRRVVYKNSFLVYMYRLLNLILCKSSLGATLKGYYLK